MANRLTTIITRTGDDGTTGLGDGSRVNKTDARVVALGDVDELNSWIGVVVAECASGTVCELLEQVQSDLFEVGAELSTPGYERLTRERLLWLEERTLRFNTELPPLKEFILPGGTRAAAFAHLARTVARRAERSVVAMRSNDLVRQYLNRLSDFLFVVARTLNRSAGGTDVVWKNTPPR